ncbi:hypothetical protein [Roseateles sp. P5_E7]
MRRIAHLVMLACAVSPLMAQAQQAAQTAEGAQRFLAALVKKGAAQAWFVDAQGRTNHVRGKATRTTTHIGILGSEETKSERAVEKPLAPFVVTEIDSETASGQKDACLTRITKWEVRDQLTETRGWQETDSGILIDTPILHSEIILYELSPELAAAHRIDWRNVKLSRSTNGAQITASFKEKNFLANLAFVPGEPELADRIEYAMKFLKLSCDDTTATGF